MVSSKDGVVWMTASLVGIGHIAISYVGVNQDLITPEWIGYPIMNLAGTGGVLVLIGFVGFIFSILGYLFLRSHKYKILSIYVVLLTASLVYNLSIIFG